MKPTTLVSFLILALTLLSAGMLSAATSERPQLKDFPNYYSFLQALETWKKEQSTPPPKVAVSTPPPPAGDVRAVVPPNIDPTSELAPPPILITGPENLDEAVELARDISHPHYKEKIRYHRSTHISFPLTPIDGSSMSHASVGEALTLGDVTGGDQKMSSEQLSSLIDQERRRLMEKSGETEPSRGIDTGPAMPPPERRSVISVMSH